MAKKLSTKVKVIILSCMVILICAALIATGTFALFTDNIKVSNHLQAGKLDATLTRTNLVYTVLEDKILTTKEETADLVLDDTTTADKNVFGITDGLTYVVPESYFEATLLLENKGDVAFDYTVELVMIEGAGTELAQQLEVTFIDHTGAKQVEMLSAIGTSITFDSATALKDSAEFTVKVKFINIVNSDMNNDAMSDAVKFDLVVSAVQTVA